MSNFKISDKFILEPAGISHDNLSTIMDKIHNKNVDYGDLYLRENELGGFLILETIIVSATNFKSKK